MVIGEDDGLEVSWVPVLRPQREFKKDGFSGLGKFCFRDKCEIHFHGPFRDVSRGLRGILEGLREP